MIWTAQENTHICCVLENKETVWPSAQSATQLELRDMKFLILKKLDRNNPNSVPDNCTYDMDCPGDHPCCILVDKATMCGKCESYYKGVCMNCNVGGEVDVVLPREKTDIFDPSNCRGNFDCTSPDAPCCKAINIPRPPYVYHFCSQC